MKNKLETWLILFSLMGILALYLLEDLIREVKKGRVFIFEKEPNSNVIDGDFKLIDNKPEPQQTPPVRRSRKRAPTTNDEGR
jgi:hypothetical protein